MGRFWYNFVPRSTVCATIDVAHCATIDNFHCATSNVPESLVNCVHNRHVENFDNWLRGKLVPIEWQNFDRGVSKLAVMNFTHRYGM